MNNNTQGNVETTATEVLAAASKTPFRTAFMITAGIGLGRLMLFALGLTLIVFAVNAVH